jgi:hypothetical protein
VDALGVEQEIKPVGILPVIKSWTTLTLALLASGRTGGTG